MQAGSLMINLTFVKVEPSNLIKKLLRKDVEFIPTYLVFGSRTANLNGQIIVLALDESQKKVSGI